MRDRRGDDNERPARTFRIRLPGFAVEDEVGLGDAIKRVTYALGIEPCSGCEQRAAALNRRIVLSPTSRRRM